MNEALAIEVHIVQSPSHQRNGRGRDFVDRSRSDQRDSRQLASACEKLPIDTTR
jgi:hypothetical protein